MIIALTLSSAMVRLYVSIACKSSQKLWRCRKGLSHNSVYQPYRSYIDTLGVAGILPCGTVCCIFYEVGDLELLRNNGHLTVSARTVEGLWSNKVHVRRKTGKDVWHNPMVQLSSAEVMYIEIKPDPRF